MTKIDVNTATRDDLVAKGGIRPQAAAAILKYRAEKGPFAAIDQLIDVPGIGAATFEQIKGVLSVPAATPEVAVTEVVVNEVAVNEAAVAEATASEAPVAEAAPEQAGAMIELAETEVLQVVESGHAVSEAAVEVLEQVVDAGAGAVEEATAVATKAPSSLVTEEEAARASGDLASLWLALATEQMSHGVESLKAVMAARSIPELVAAQNDFIRGSMVRFLEATDRCMRLTKDITTGFTAGPVNRLDKAA